MGRIAKVLSFLRTERNGATLSDVKLDPGGGPNITGEHFADPGDDSYPLDTDYAATTDISRSGGEVPVGYADPINTPKALKGDKRIYGRNSSGQAVNEVWLKNDESILVDNDKGSIELKASGATEVSNDKGSIELKDDGEVLATNDGGSITLKPDGTLVADANTSMSFTAPLFTFTGNMVITGTLTLGGIFSAITGALATIGGLIMTGGDVIADSKSLKLHTHPQGVDSASDTQANTGAPL